MQHTKCGLVGVSDAQLRELTGADLGFLPIDDHAAALREDVELLARTPVPLPAAADRRVGLRRRERAARGRGALGATGLRGAPGPRTRTDRGAGRRTALWPAGVGLQCSDTFDQTHARADGTPATRCNPTRWHTPGADPKEPPCRPTTPHPSDRPSAARSRQRRTAARAFAPGGARRLPDTGPGPPRRDPGHGVGRHLPRQRRPARELRRRRLLRPGRRADPRTRRRSAWPRPTTARGTGSSPPTAASSTTATRSFFGSAGALPLNKPIVGMAATPDGGGYWLVASDGGIFSYGDAHFYGSTGSMQLNQPIVGMAATPGRRRVLARGLRRRHLRLRRRPVLRLHGRRSTSTSRSSAWRRHRAASGYWLVASDGGIFAYGTAPFLGSIGRHAAQRPHRGDGRHGERLLAGRARTAGSSTTAPPFLGSMGGQANPNPIRAIAATPSGQGYWLLPTSPPPIPPTVQLGFERAGGGLAADAAARPRLLGRHDERHPSTTARSRRSGRCRRRPTSPATASSDRPPGPPSRPGSCPSRSRSRATRSRSTWRTT